MDIGNTEYKNHNVDIFYVIEPPSWAKYGSSTILVERNNQQPHPRGIRLLQAEIRDVRPGEVIVKNYVFVPLLITLITTMIILTGLSISGVPVPIESTTLNNAAVASGVLGFFSAIPCALNPQLTRKNGTPSRKRRYQVKTHEIGDLITFPNMDKSLYHTYPWAKNDDVIVKSINDALHDMDTGASLGKLLVALSGYRKSLATSIMDMNWELVNEMTEEIFRITDISRLKKQSTLSNPESEARAALSTSRELVPMIPELDATG